MRLGHKISLFGALFVVVALAVGVAAYSYSQKTNGAFRTGDAAYRKTHPLYAYSISGEEACCLSPNSDNLKVKLNSRALTYFLKELSGTNLFGPASGDQISLVSFSPKGNYIAIVFGYNTVVIWNVAKEREQSRFYVRNGNEYKKAIWGSDERFLTFGHVSGPFTVDAGATIWDPVTGTESGKLEGYTLFSAISPSGKNIVSRVYKGPIKSKDEFGPGAYSWRIYNTVDWSYSDLDEYYVHLCNQNVSDQFIYDGVTFVRDDKFLAFGQWISRDKESVCGYNNSSVPTNELFVAPFDLNGKKSQIFSLKFRKNSSPSEYKTISDFNYIKDCKYQYNIEKNIVYFARGLALDYGTYSVMGDADGYKSYYPCAFYAPDPSGEYIYSVDTANFNNTSDSPIGRVQSIATGKIVASFPVNASRTIGGVDVSPNGDLLAVTSYKSVDIYHIR